MGEMSEIVELTRHTAFINAELSYIVDDGIMPVRYIDWPEQEHNEHLPTYERRLTRIHNGRTAGETFTLPSHGFAFIGHGTAVKDFYDEDEVQGVYYPETERLIREHSGAARVVVFDHTLRTAEKSRHAERWIRNPVHSVHNDYTAPKRALGAQATTHCGPPRSRATPSAGSATRSIRSTTTTPEVLGEDEAETLLKRRFGIVQTWQPIAAPIESEPLALCDGRTIPEVGFIRNERRYRDRTAETYHISYNPAHRWFYFPHMTRNEALVFKVFDTDASAGVRFTAHTAFDDPTGAPDAKPRESIEMRALAFY